MPNGPGRPGFGSKHEVYGHFYFGMDNVFQDQVKEDQIAQDKECQIGQEDQNREHLDFFQVGLEVHTGIYTINFCASGPGQGRPDCSGQGMAETPGDFSSGDFGFGRKH